MAFTQLTERIDRFKESLGKGMRNSLHKGNHKDPYDRIIPYSQYAPWWEDDRFVNDYRTIEARKATLVDIYRCFELNALAKQLSAKYPGKCNILEVGVYRGGTGAVLASAVKDNANATVHLVDTFNGVVKATNRDKKYNGGEHSDTSEEFVERLIAELKLSNVRIYKGIFPDDFSECFDDMMFHMVHIDVDVYRSGKDILEYIWPRLVSGGVVVFDDYGFRSTNGITELCNEFQNKLDAVFIYNLNAHGIFVKV